MRRATFLLTFYLSFFGICCLISCSSKVLAPIKNNNFSSVQIVQVWRRGVIENPGQYRVVKGDSLFAIAWRFGIDHRQILRFNNIVNKDLIFEGQILRLDSEGAAPESVSSVNQKKTRLKRDLSLRPSQYDWNWPVTGEFEKVHDGDRLIGLEIYGPAGREIKSASSGLQFPYSFINSS